MAEDNKLLIEIEASTVNAVKAIDNLDASLKDFGKSGTVSISQIELALESLRDAASRSVDLNEIKALGEEYRKLALKLKETENAFYGLGDSTKRARTSALALNQVIRDAPFGFIAISNNIPVLTDQLQELYRINNSKIIPTLKDFVKGLTGAGGITLAIGLAVGAITTLVQKYGSLSAANDQLSRAFSPLLSKLGQARDAVEKLNEKIKTSAQLNDESSRSVAAETSVLGNLIQLVNSETISKEEKATAIQRINDSNDKYIKDIVIEKDNIQKLNELYPIYIKYLESEARVKNLISQKTTRQEQLDELNRAQQEINKGLDQERKKRNEVDRLLNKGLISIAEASGRRAVINTVINKLSEDELKNKESIKIIQSDILQISTQITDEVKNSIKAENDLANFTKSNFKSKKAIAAAAKAQTVTDKTTAKAEEDAIKRKQELLRLEIQGYKDRIKNLDRYSTNAIEIFQELEKKEFELAKIDAEKLFNGKELEKAIELLKANVFEKYRAAYKEFLDNKNALIKKEEELNDKQLNGLDKYIDATTKAYDKLDFGGVERRNKEFFKNLAKENEDAQDAIDKQRKAQQELANVLGQALGRGIDNFVDGIADGKKGADALKESFVQIGEELKKIIIKLLIIEGLKILANILAPGSGKAVGPIASKALGVPDLSGLLGGGRGQTKGGINIGPGGLAIAGQVTFVQRGPDLVGVLAQANNRINRVG